MNALARLATALLCWAAAAAAGWWWQHPGASAQAAPTPSAAASARAAPQAAPEPQAQARRIAAVDPMGLNRAELPAAGASPANAPGSDAIVWRLAALVVRDAERYAVLTAADQVPLRLRINDALPDGDRIKAIHANRIDIQSPRGRVRSLYMIEP